MPAISIVIPVRNGEAYLAATLESLFVQTVAPKEILVIDDGSTDSTSAVAASYGTAIRTIKLSGRGAATARNVGIEESTGELIAFLDADDICLPQRLEQQQRSLVDDPEAAMTYCALAYIDSSGKLTGEEIRCPEYQREGFFGQLLERNRIGTTSATMAHRSTLINLSGFDESLAYNEEYDLWLRLAANHQIIYQDEILLHYRLHQNNISRSRRGQQQNEKLALLKHSLHSIESALQKCYPDRTEAQLALAQIMYKRNEFDKMRSILKALRDEKEPHPMSYFLSGNLFWLSGEPAKAQEAFLSCLQLDPEYAPAHNNLGITLAADKQNEQARKAFTRAMALKHHYADPRHNLHNLDNGQNENWHLTAVPLRDVLKPELGI